jgi:hypothetical protein
MSNPFNNIIIRNWFSPIHRGDNLPIAIVLIGSDPFEYDDFKSFLKSLEFNVFKAPYNLETLIVGRNECDDDVINEQIDLRQNKKLKIYSQEMFLCYLYSGKDPYLNTEVLSNFTNYHPVFDFIRDTWIDWPSTHVGFTFQPLKHETTEDWLKNGILHTMGYSVGRNGLNEIKRRNILLRTYTTNLPNNFSEDYLRQWGKPNSPERLLKMANTIAAFARNAKKRRNPTHKYAIKDWESDLNWLKEQFYHGRYTFIWPSYYIE